MAKGFFSTCISFAAVTVNETDGLDFAVHTTHGAHYMIKHGTWFRHTVIGKQVLTCLWFSGESCKSGKFNLQNFSPESIR